MAKSLESVLAHVSQDRRGFLKTMLIGSAVAAVPMMTSEIAQAQDEGKGEGKKKKGEGKKKKEG
jgi:hypothetical protein